MREICPALGVERHCKTFASRVKLARQLAESRKPQDPVDRRSRRLSLTPEGKTLLASAVPVWEQTHREVEALLKDADKEIDPDRLRHGLLALC